MRQVAVVAVVGLVAATAATTFILNSRERTEILEQSRVQHEELTRRLDRLERMLVVLRDRNEQPGVVSQGSPSGPQASRDTVTKDAAKTDVVADKRPDREERIQAGNAIVDRALQVGRWSARDAVAFGVATNGLTGEEREQMMLRLMAAVNANQVQLDMRRPGR